MAELVISTVVEVTLSKVISLVDEQINLQWGFKDELRKLSDSITLTHAFLKDAETRQVHDESIQVWLKQLRKIAYEADDVLDELAYEDLRRKVETQMRKKVRNFFSISKNPIVFCFKMPQTVKGIKLSLNEINDGALKFRLQQRVQTLPPSSGGTTQVTHAFGDSSQVEGRKNDVSKIIDLLIGSSTSQTFSIVSIVGMGGLGKTTLAKSVCNNEQTKNYFNKIIWVCVSEKIDVERILEEMFESLTGQPWDMKSKTAMLEKIKKELEGKTYLLVLDDVWDEDRKTWEDLRGSLLGINENKRSSILVTSRSEEVAVVRETPRENRYHLGRLMDDECWAIIKSRAFQNSSMPSDLEHIGKEIAGKCAGVPLVASVIGGTMCNKLALDEWVSLRDSSRWGSLETNEGILSVLRLSFDRLPSSSLKQCFAYCSIFPKDFRIQKEQLIQLWMAEGFLQESEDIGNGYFKYLLSNSLLQDVEIDDLRGFIKSCKMHDFVHDLAQSIINSETRNASQSQQQYEFDGVKLWHSWFSESKFFHIKADFKSLRVIKFSNAEICSLSDSIGKLKHLRYLDISSTGIQRLPKSITQLYHLQTLRLLRCKSLQKLPKGMKNLFSLRHLCFDDPKHAPDEIGCLTSLQTLSMFVVGRKRRCGIGELGCLSKLEGYLKICDLHEVRNKEEAQGAKIWEKKKLHTLKYRWQKKDYSNDEEVLEGLEPHSNLKSLTIDGYNGVSNPSWLIRKSDSGPSVSFQPINLVKLSLLSCENLKNLPTLGQCPKLKFLRLKGLDNVQSIGNEFYINNNSNSCDSQPTTLFPALEIFNLLGMRNLKEWLEVEPTIPMFPSLKELNLGNCPKLNSVPVMSRFSSLERLVLDDCKELSLLGDGLFPSTLKELAVQSCRKLRSIPSVEGGISFLQLLWVSGCDELSKIEEGLLASTCLRDVYIDSCPNLTSFPLNPSIDCEGLTSLPSGLPSSTSLKILSVLDCKNLKSIPEQILGCLTRLKTLELGPFSEELEEFPGLSSIHRLHSSLECLTLYGWEKLSSLPDQLQHLTALEILRSQNFNGVNALPEWLGNLSSLRDLRITSCQNLKRIPGEILGCLTRLKTLILGPFSEELEEFPGLSSIHRLHSSLKHLTLSGWEKLSSLPDQLQHLTALEGLWIHNFYGVKALPEWLGNLSSLQNLGIRSCQNLKSIPGEILGCLTRLKTLALGPFSEELEEFPDLTFIHRLHSSLEDLTLYGWEKLSSLPDQLQHLTALKSLSITRFSGVNSLPEWLGNLSSLRHLNIWNCENLKHLPSKEAMQRLSNLQRVSIKDCPQLERNSAERSKLSHIPEIYINGIGD